jgi:hypothetical protein
MRQRLRDFVVQLCIALIVVVSSVLGPILLVAISVPSVFASVPTVVVVLFGAMASSWFTLFPFLVYISLALILSAVRPQSALWSFGSHLAAAAVATVSSAALWSYAGDGGAGALFVHGGVAALALRFALAVCLTHFFVKLVRSRRREAPAVSSETALLASP